MHTLKLLNIDDLRADICDDGETDIGHSEKSICPNSPFTYTQNVKGGITNSILEGYKN